MLWEAVCVLYLEIQVHGNNNISKKSTVLLHLFPKQNQTNPYIITNGE